ncbi:hypothetical protein ACF0H5_014768 [Mactra antiquata]
MAGKGQKHEGQRVVAIAVDDSEFSEQALDFYAANAKRDDDYVVLIHCPELYDLSMASPAVVDQLMRELQAKVEALENKYKERIQNINLCGKFRTGQGKPGEIICRVAQEEDATMIICGTRGLGKIRRTIMGSVSDYVIHHSHVPVLVCRHN